MIYQLGLPKTGTSTLIKALKILDCKYLAGDGAIFWEREGKIPNITEHKYILTIRKTDEIWFNSVYKWSRIKGKEYLQYNREKMYGYKMPTEENKKHFIECYNNHNENMIKKYNPLVVCWENGDSWEKLCNYLDKSIPNENFPHENKNIVNIFNILNAIL